MASYARKFLAIFLFLTIAVFFFSTLEVQAKVCLRYSKYFQGKCFDPAGCKNNCTQMEKAISGDCHPDHGFGSACLCLFNC
ncbi:Defensin-like protein [Medicago truncatula]|uniref:Defensin-like protein n=1 Tax=Medicago truncatula TaxID=3880 RepID=A0A072TL61_MEDTR|nr:Defensin-like protein [Medicago truncatula]